MIVICPFPVGKKEKGKKGNKEEEGKKKKPEEDEDLGFKMAPSNFLADLMVCNSEYDELWKHMDESSNPLQTYYLDMVRAAKTAEVEAELRKVSKYVLPMLREGVQAPCFVTSKILLLTHDKG